MARDSNRNRSSVSPVSSSCFVIVLFRMDTFEVLSCQTYSDGWLSLLGSLSQIIYWSVLPVSLGHGPVRGGTTRVRPSQNTWSPRRTRGRRERTSSGDEFRGEFGVIEQTEIGTNNWLGSVSDKVWPLLRFFFNMVK